MSTFKAIHNASSSGFILEDDLNLKIHLTIGDRQHGGRCVNGIDLFNGNGSDLFFEEEKLVTQNEKLPHFDAFVGREFTRTCDVVADEHELTFSNGDTIRLGTDEKEPSKVFARATINHVFTKTDLTRFQQWQVQNPGPYETMLTPVMSCGQQSFASLPFVYTDRQLAQPAVASGMEIVFPSDKRKEVVELVESTCCPSFGQRMVKNTIVTDDDELTKLAQLRIQELRELGFSCTHDIADVKEGILWERMMLDAEAETEAKKQASSTDNTEKDMEMTLSSTGSHEVDKQKLIHFMRNAVVCHNTCQFQFRANWETWKPILYGAPDGVNEGDPVKDEHQVFLYVSFGPYWKGVCLEGSNYVLLHGPAEKLFLDHQPLDAFAERVLAKPYFSSVTAMTLDMSRDDNGRR